MKIIQSVMTERINEISNEVLMQNEEYRGVMEKASEIVQQIEDALPPNLKKLVLDLDNYICQQLAISEEVLYTHGVSDGAILLRRGLHECHY